MQPKKMEDLVTFGAKEVKSSNSRGKRKRRVFLCRRTVRVKVRSKVIPVSFLKVEGGHLLEQKTGKSTNQQLPQRCGSVPTPIWVGSKCLLALPRVPVTPGTPLQHVKLVTEALMSVAGHQKCDGLIRQRVSSKGLDEMF